MHTNSREEEIRHAGTVCGWFSEEWDRRGHARARRTVEPVVILGDVVSLVSEVREDLAGLIDRAFSQTHRIVYIGNLPQGSLAVAATPSSPAELAVRDFAARVHEVGAVEAVLFDERDGRVQVWTVMDGHDRAAEDRVYAAEEQTLAEHQDTLFNFGILYRHGRPIEQVRPSSCKNASSRA
jgi:hypothetical protein